MTFNEAFDLLMTHEGGYVNHAADPGGKTNFGITESVARQHGFKGDMRDMVRADAKRIYESAYWDTTAGRLPDGHAVAFDLFDAAVHHGPTQAIKFMQGAAGLGVGSIDGILGARTIEVVSNQDGRLLAARMLGERLAFMTNLTPWGVFSRGWARRVAANLARLR